MKRDNPGALLSTVFVDYDNIYLSLKRKSEEAAKRFAKDAPLWLGELVSGRLLTATNGPALDMPRRIVMNRCYGNPVPRRNNADNSTDMNSFPFVRHHFLRAGFEVVDCPPLTAQLKNSSDIRMVMDVRDYLTHETYFDEFIILSGDADFTPLLHRLRAHARRTVIFANDYTAAPYTAISDGEVRESALIQLLLEGKMLAPGETSEAMAPRAQLPSPADTEETRRIIVKEVVEAVRSAGQPVPLEALADRAVRNLGHDRTVGTAWGGAGGFRDLLLKALPEDIQLNEQPPYFVFDTGSRVASEPARPAAPAISEEPRPALGAARIEPQLPISEPVRREPRPELGTEPLAKPLARSLEGSKAEPRSSERAPEARPLAEAKPQPKQQSRDSAAAEYDAARQGFMGAPPPAPPQPAQPPLPPAAAAPVAPPQRPAAPPRSTADSGATTIQRSIARIHEACQAPPLSPPEYRALFDVISDEITRNGLNGAQTLVTITQRAQELGIDIRRDDVRFVLDVISETDPWFEQGASQRLFAGRFRNFVVARCRSQGLSLSAEELDLIDAWFAGGPAAQPQRGPAVREQRMPQPAAATGTGDPHGNNDRGWVAPRSAEPPAGAPLDRFGAPDDLGGDEFPRIVRRGR